MTEYCICSYIDFIWTSQLVISFLHFIINLFFLADLLLFTQLQFLSRNNPVLAHQETSLLMSPTKILVRQKDFPAMS
jgi:hypothetical protein